MEKKLSKILYISIDGTLGAGKTTLLQKLRQHFENNDGYQKVQILEEPVTGWRQWDGMNPLQLFYENPEVAYPFQIFIQGTLGLKLYDAISLDKSVIVQERSPLSSALIFGRTLQNQGHLTKSQLRTLEEIADTSMSPIGKKLFYVLDIPVELAIHRIMTRGRTEESNISAKYLTTLNECISHFVQKVENLPNCSVEVHDEPGGIEREILGKIDDFIGK